MKNFNAWFPTWWDDDETSLEGSRLDSLSSFHGLHQLLKEPAHLIESLISCIELIFTNEPNLVIDSGFHPSLHTNHFTKQYIVN